MVLQRFASVFSRYSDQKTMKYFCNRLFDKMFKSKSVTEDSIVKFGRAIDFHVKDVKLNKLLKKCFGQYNAYEIKSIVENTPDEEISKLSTVDAQRCLMNVINEEKDDSIRQFIKMLCLPIQSYLEWCYDEYKTKVGLDEELFPDYVLEDIVKTKYFNKCGFVHSEYCLLSHFIQCNFEEETLMGKNEYLNIEIDLEKCDSIKSIVKMLVTNYQIINNIISAKGNNYSGTFKGALNLVNKLTPVWDKLLASSLIRDKSLSRPSPPQTSLNDLSDDEMFSIYAGKYSLVPRSYPEVTNVSANMIFNMNQFKQLSYQRKKQVCAYLENNKSRFNRLLNEVAETIHDELSDKLNYRNIRNLTSTSKLYKCASLLNDSFNSHAFNSPDKLLSYVVHEYIPIIKQFNNLNDDLCENIRKNIYGGAPNNDIVELIRGGLELNDVFDEIYEYKPESKPKPEIKYVPQIINNQTQSKPVEKIVYKYISTPSPKIYGGDEEFKSIEDYVRALIDIQRKFNNGYEVFYRGLTEELNKVTIPNDTVDKTNLYNLVQQFEQIAIKRSKTTCYISGIYSAKNYNKIYLDMVKTLISNIEHSGSNFLNGPLEKLKELSSLLINTARDVSSIQVKLLSSPRGDNDYMIMNTRKILKPSNLNSDDFNNLTIAIRKILSSINSARVEGDVYNFKNSLNKFIEKAGDRNKMIKEYYELEKQRFVYENQSSFFDYKSRNGNVQRINNILIDRKAEAMTYMNSVVDMELAKVKLNNAAISQLSEKDMKSIEEIYLNFKYAQSSLELDDIFTKIKKLETNSYEGILTIIKKLKKVFKASGQVKMIIDIYKRLKIFPDDFDWSKFEHEYIDLVTLNTVKIGHIYKITRVFDENNKESVYYMSYSQIVETLANSCELFSGKYVDMVDGNYDITKVVYQMIHDLFNTSITEAKFSRSLRNIASSSLSWFLSDGLPSRNDPIGIRYNDINYGTNCVKIEGNKINVCEKTNLVNSDLVMGFTTPDTMNELFRNVEGDRRNNYLYKILNAVSHVMLSKARNCMISDTDSNFKAETPYYIKHWPIPVLELVYAIKNNPNIKSFVNGSIMFTNNFGVDIIKDRNVECDIAAYSIEALYANIADYIDSYWKLKYNGTLPIVQGISNALRGGSKLNGASLMDYGNPITPNYSEIIDDAVPFYVTALNVMDYYIRKFYSARDTNDNGVIRLRLKFNKLSILYPVYKILGKNTMNLNGITEQYLRECLYVFNKIWNMSDGDPGIRLSKSVDILLNEIHSNFLFASKASEDILEFTETSYQEFTNMMDINVEEISKTLKDTLKDIFISSTESNKYLETYLRNAYETVKNSGTNKLNTLKDFLTNNLKNNYYDDFYNFMDLVIAPLLIINESYKKKFSLFSFDVNKVDDIIDAIDLNSINVIYLDMSTENPIIRSITVSEIIKNVRNGYAEYKSLLFYNPAVTNYNRYLLKKALSNFHKTNRFIIPQFWIAMDENTYPISTQLEKIYNNKNVSSKNISEILQIWGNLDGKTIIDYYNQCTSEFVSDFNHILQSFISYPGVTDKMAKRLIDSMKDSIKVKGIKIQNNQPYLKLNITDYKYDNMLKALSDVKIRDIETNSIAVPSIKPIQIPPLNESKIIEGLSIVSNSVPNSIRIGNSNSYLCRPSSCEYNDEIRTLSKIDYDWVDWVIIMIARCDSVNYCLPYKLVNMLQSQSSLQTYIRSPGYKSRDQRILYMVNTPGTSNNIITQNIIARSISDFNKDHFEYSTLPQIQIASIVSMLPYIISVLKTNLKFLSIRDFNGDELQMINSLVETLTLFFYDIGTFTPYIGFMADSLEVMSGKDKAHSFGELFADMYTTNKLTTADDFLHLEWANKIFFSYISELKFPEYKNKPQFSKYEELVKNIIIQPSFKDVYENTKTIVARNVWSYLLIKYGNKNKSEKFDNNGMDKLIMDILFVMSGCGDDVIQRFIDNVIKSYNNQTYVYDNGLYQLTKDLIKNIIDGDVVLGFKCASRYNNDTLTKIKNIWNNIDGNNIDQVIDGIDNNTNFNVNDLNCTTDDYDVRDFLQYALIYYGRDNDFISDYLNYLETLNNVIDYIRGELNPDEIHGGDGDDSDIIPDAEKKRAYDTSYNTLIKYIDLLLNTKTDLYKATLLNEYNYNRELFYFMKLIAIIYKSLEDSIKDNKFDQILNKVFRCGSVAFRLMFCVQRIDSTKIISNSVSDDDTIYNNFSTLPDELKPRIINMNIRNLNHYIKYYITVFICFFKDRCAKRNIECDADITGLLSQYDKYMDIVSRYAENTEEKIINIKDIKLKSGDDINNLFQAIIEQLNNPKLQFNIKLKKSFDMIKFDVKAFQYSPSYSSCNDECVDDKKYPSEKNEEIFMNRKYGYYLRKWANYNAHCLMHRIQHWNEVKLVSEPKEPPKEESKEEPKEDSKDEIKSQLINLKKCGQTLNDAASTLGIKLTDFTTAFNDIVNSVEKFDESESEAYTGTIDNFHTAFADGAAAIMKRIEDIEGKIDEGAAELVKRAGDNEELSSILTEIGTLISNAYDLIAQFKENRSLERIMNLSSKVMDTYNEIKKANESVRKYISNILEGFASIYNFMCKIAAKIDYEISSDFCDVCENMYNAFTTLDLSLMSEYANIINEFITNFEAEIDTLMEETCRIFSENKMPVAFIVGSEKLVKNPHVTKEWIDDVLGFLNSILDVINRSKEDSSEDSPEDSSKDSSETSSRISSTASLETSSKESLVTSSTTESFEVPIETRPDTFRLKISMSQYYKLNQTFQILYELCRSCRSLHTQIGTLNTLVADFYDAAYESGKLEGTRSNLVRSERSIISELTKICNKYKGTNDLKSKLTELGKNLNENIDTLNNTAATLLYDIYSSINDYESNMPQRFSISSDFYDNLKESLCDKLNENVASLNRLDDIKTKLGPVIRDISDPGSLLSDAMLSKIVNCMVNKVRRFSFREVATNIAINIAEIKSLSVEYVSPSAKIGFRPNTLNRISDLTLKFKDSNYDKYTIDKTIKLFDKEFNIYQKDRKFISYKSNINTLDSFNKISQLQTLTNNIIHGFNAEEYTPRASSMIRITNVRPLMERTRREIRLNDKMFAYIFDSGPYRKYYINSPRCDIQNATTGEKILDLKTKYKSKYYYQIIHNILLTTKDYPLISASNPKGMVGSLLTYAYPSKYSSPIINMDLIQLIDKIYNISNSYIVAISSLLNNHGRVRDPEWDDEFSKNYVGQRNNVLQYLRILYTWKQLFNKDDTSASVLAYKSMDSLLKSSIKWFFEADENYTWFKNQPHYDKTKQIYDYINDLVSKTTKCGDDKKKEVDIESVWDGLIGKPRSDLKEYSAHLAAYICMKKEIEEPKKETKELKLNAKYAYKWGCPGNIGDVFNTLNNKKEKDAYDMEKLKSICYAMNPNKVFKMPVFYIGDYFDETTPDQIKDTTKPSHFDLSYFINSFIGYTFNKSKIDKDPDTGFATRLKMHGGYTRYDILNNYININNYINGKRGEFKYLYEYDNDLAEATRLFNTLFKGYGRYYDGLRNQSDIITLGVFNYFHKFNLSCASIYNRILFPNIIYNASILRNYISVLAKNVKQVDIKNENVSEIFTFISNINSKYTDALDLVNDWRNNICVGKRKPTETYTSFNSMVIKDKKYIQSAIANINITPSLINKYFTELLRNLSPVSTNDKIIDFSYKNSLVTSLYNSPFMIEFNHVNLLNTIIYSILRILKATSYYDIETDTDYAYNNGLLLEPFVE